MKIALIFSKCRLSLRISIRNFWWWATTYRKGTDADAVSAANFLKLKAFINSKITGENKFEILEITREFGLNYLRKLQVSKATGLAGINVWLLRAAAPAITSSLTKVINASINSGRFPACWKEARVCPVYKDWDRLSVDNYRPISILSILSKVLERHVYPSMYEHLTINLLSIHQSRFRPYHSCDTALIKLTDSIVTNMDKGLISGFSIY